MIRNERQYRISKSRAEDFRKAFERLDAQPVLDNRNAAYLEWKLQRDSIKSQLEELDQDLQEYEALKTGQVTEISVLSLAELPTALVKARISSGLTQRDLAERLGMKEQQIQRYEATQYQGVALDRIRQIASVLALHFQGGVLLPDEKIDFERIASRAEEVGFDRDFLLRRVMPQSLRAAIEKELPVDSIQALLLAGVDRLARILRVSVSEIIGSTSLQISDSAISAARFKVPANYRRSGLAAYSLYAHYLALLVLQATQSLISGSIPASWKHVRRQVLAKYGELSLSSVTSYCWDIGTPVLPLRDRGQFHGATWRSGGRNIIVVKQSTSSAARWMTDILHELWHAAQSPELESASYVELDPRSPEYGNSVDEEIASDFAADVLLNGKAEDLAEQCAVVCNRRMEWLKSAVIKVARSNAVREDVLANYMAYRLSLEGQDWWGTANALQSAEPDGWTIVRDVALERIDWESLTPNDRELLQEALSL